MPYEYKALVTSVYDGDTITIDLDLGLKSWHIDKKCRLFGIDTPELRGHEKEAGKRARDALRKLILDKEVIVRTEKDKSGKYGRLIVTVYTLDGLNVNEWLVSNGYAVEKEY